VSLPDERKLELQQYLIDVCEEKLEDVMPEVMAALENGELSKEEGEYLSGLSYYAKVKEQ